MRFLTSLILGAVLACSPGSATQSIESVEHPTSPTVKMLRVYRGQEKLTIQMGADDRVLDGAGAAVGRFDLNSRVVTIGNVRIPLDEVVRARDGSGVTLEFPIGTWRFDVAPDGALRLNGEHWGRLEGFDLTPQAWLRLEALFASLPVMPVAPRPREPAL
jgi:hypothetical protein